MGTIRERRPGVWEIRVAVGTHPVTGRTTQRSVTFHGDECDARAYASELAAEAVARRTITMPAPMITVAAVLSRWLDADQPWKPSTYVGYRSNAGFLQRDAIGGVRVATLSPRLIRAAFARWEADGGTSSVIAGRFRVLRSAIGWAYDERIIDDHPIRTMRGPARPEPRRPIAHDDLTALLRTAEERLLEALANDTGAGRTRHRRHMAEQDLLLVRLAADSGARRGELVALQFSDFDDRVLHISRAMSDGVLTTPKSGHGRHLTLGASTAHLAARLHLDWHQRAASALGPWVFSGSTDHTRPMTVSGLGHRFAKLAGAAGVPSASLHRLRHSVASFLVARGEILQAQARLGHADPSTTLREYAYAIPLQDRDVADAIDDHLTWVERDPDGTRTLRDRS
jgi:integrase